MSWVRIDDSLWSHPKMLGLPAGAVRLWLFGLCWAAQHLSDGRVSHAVVRLLGGKKSDTKFLVSSGLWEPTEDGFQIHDYLEFQAPRARVLAEREAAKARMRRVRSPEHSPNFGRSSPTPSHPIPSVLTREGDPKDLTGHREAPPPRDLPPHLRSLEQSFWRDVGSWCGPVPEHRDFARQNGLDLAVEERQYRANRKKNAYRCADFDADFSEWLAKSLKFARAPRNGSAAATAAALPDELTQRDREEIARSRARLRRKGVIA